MWGTLASGALSFLGGLLSSTAGSAAGSYAGGLAQGGDKGLSWSTFDRAQQQTDVANTNEIGRQTAFLKGMTPVQGDMYNQYQDQTYGQDTARQIGRVQETASALKMSPWEVTGAPGASPVPSPVMGNVNPASGGASAAPLLTAAMQAKTALKIAQMNNQTSLQNTAMQTGNARTITGMQTDNGNVAKADVQLKKTQTALTDLDKDLRTEQIGKTVADTTATISDAMVRKATAVFSMLPKDSTSLGPFTRNETPQAYNVIQWLQGSQNQQDFESKIKGMSSDDLSKAVKQFKDTLGTTAQAGMNGMQDLGNWFNGIGQDIGKSFKGQGPKQ